LAPSLTWWPRSGPANRARRS
ncbi:hypothetical protein A2U01_0116147, partial [Trifolium medium]|nr:hypothetical protein [Trifolium medium]